MLINDYDVSQEETKIFAESCSFSVIVDENLVYWGEDMKLKEYGKISDWV
jgi:hypothetical protein